MAANMVVRTNVFSLNAHRNMKNVGLEQRRASNRLASGYRINSAADDAAGLAISENMRAQIRGLDQASRNAQDGQAMILTTEGGLNEIGNMLVRVRELLVQASNDTNTSDQRVMIEQEVNQLSSEILAMRNRVEFNSSRVLAMGPAMDADVINQVALLQTSSSQLATWADEINRALSDVTNAMNMLTELDPMDALEGAQLTAVTDATGELTLTTLTNPVTDADLVDADHITGFAAIFTGIAVADDNLPHADLTAVAAADNQVGGVTNSGGWTVAMGLQALAAQQSALNEALNNVNTRAGTIRTVADGNMSTARAHAAASSSGQFVAFFQIGANANQGTTYDFERVSRSVNAAGWVVSTIAASMAAPGAGSGIGNGVSITTLIDQVDSSITDVNSVRANLGALQNRLDYTMRSLDISSENLSDAESRVRNADIAREMMRFTMTNVLQQAATAMLAQANQIPQNLLQLLR